MKLEVSYSLPGTNEVIVHAILDPVYNYIASEYTPTTNGQTLQNSSKLKLICAVLQFSKTGNHAKPSQNIFEQLEE